MKKLIVILFIVLWAGIAFGGAVSMNNIDEWGVLKTKASSSVYIADSVLTIQAGNDPSDPYDWVTVSRAFELCEGEELSGWSKFITYDYDPFDYDYASVTVGWFDGYQLMWEKTIADTTGYSTDAIGVTDWERWAFTAPKTGEYNLIIYAQGDDELDSYSYHRDLAIGCRCQSVPEPASFLLLGIGLLGLTGLKRRIK